MTTDLGGAETGRGRSIERANGLRDGASTVASSGFYSVHEKVKLIISTVFTALQGLLSINRTRRVLVLRRKKTRSIAVQCFIIHGERSEPRAARGSFPSLFFARKDNYTCTYDG